jgi:hypothetical protein
VRISLGLVVRPRPQKQIISPTSRVKFGKAILIAFRPERIELPYTTVHHHVRGVLREIPLPRDRLELGGGLRPDARREPNDRLHNHGERRQGRTTAPPRGHNVSGHTFGPDPSISPPARTLERRSASLHISDGRLKERPGPDQIREGLSQGSHGHLNAAADPNHVSHGHLNATGRSQSP